MKKIILKHANNVDLEKVFSASIRAGSTYNYQTTLETHSNDTSPSLRCVSNFIVIVEPYD